MRSYLTTAGAFILAAMTLPSIAQAATDPSGVWLDDKGRGAIEIKPCGDDYCGYVVWVKDTNDTRGCGKQIIGNVSATGSGIWDNGWIYSPERKKKYSVELKLLSDNQLRVKGYAGTKFFSKTMVWTKAPDTLTRSDDAVYAKKTEPAAESAPALQPATPPDVTSDAPPATTAAKPDAASPSAADTAEAPMTEPQKDTGDAASPPAQKPAAPQKKEMANAAPPPDVEDGPSLGDLPIDKYFNKTADGRCKLDLPWVKLDFACD